MGFSRAGRQLSHFFGALVTASLVSSCAFLTKGMRDPDPDKANIKSAMKEKEDEVAGCYESYIKTGGTEEGKLDVRFEFDGTGRVSNLKVDSKSLKDPKLLSCFRTKLSDLKVDPSSTGKVVKIYYPIFVRITK